MLFEESHKINLKKFTHPKKRPYFIPCILISQNRGGGNEMTASFLKQLRTFSLLAAKLISNR